MRFHLHKKEKTVPTDSKSSVSSQKKNNIDGITPYKIISHLQRSSNALAIEYGEISARVIYNAFGQLLYFIGYEAEYFLLSIQRGIKFAFKVLKALNKRVYNNALTFCNKIGAAILYDFKEPWKRAVSGYNHIKEEVRLQREKEGHKAAALTGAAYFWSGIRAYAHLVTPLLGYLLPLSAALIFAFTVNSVLSYNFALKVEANGENVGYIENQNVFEEAQSLVRGRIRSTKEEGEWNINPTFTLVTANPETLVSRNALADTLVETSKADIQNATGIMVDGDLLGVTSDGDILQNVLDDLRAPYIQSDNPNLRVEFVKKVELIPGIYLTSSITKADAIVEKLTGQVEGQRVYNVQRGDSPSLIAQKNGVPIKDLYTLNPKMEAKDYKMPIGDELIIAKQQNFLQVKTVERVTKDTTIPFDKISTNTEDLNWGTSKVLVEGQDGLEQHIVDITRIDDVIVGEDTIQIIPISEPVTQEELVGIKNAYGGMAGAASTGNMIWPIPGYRGVSQNFRGSAHRGLDIRGAYGTPILAADNGIVQFAGSGRGSAYWSYGNFVKLVHSNGTTTLYGHCSSVAVSSGDYVSKGEVIAYVGSTGRSSGNHCHFETTLNGRLVDPYNFVKRP
ncbi:MAG: M23 family metallopeptidase [Oscillospiraceae bacterium]